MNNSIIHIGNKPLYEGCPKYRDKFYILKTKRAISAKLSQILAISVNGI